MGSKEESTNNCGECKLKQPFLDLLKLVDEMNEAIAKLQGVSDEEYKAYPPSKYDGKGPYFSMSNGHQFNCRGEPAEAEHCIKCGYSSASGNMLSPCTGKRKVSAEELLKRFSKRDRQSIYDFAMKRSEELKAGKGRSRD